MCVVADRVCRPCACAQIFDTFCSGGGALSLQELSLALQQYGPRLPLGQVRYLMARHGQPSPAKVPLARTHTRGQAHVQ